MLGDTILEMFSIERVVIGETTGNVRIPPVSFLIFSSNAPNDRETIVCEIYTFEKFNLIPLPDRNLFRLVVRTNLMI